MQKYIDTIQARSIDGSSMIPLSSATVSVFLSSSPTTLATIYADNDESPLDNPFSSASDGTIAFYAANGRYNIVASKPGYRTVTFSDVLFEDDSSLSATTGAASVGSDDGASGSLWTTVAGFISRIVSSAGASVVGFIQAGTGAGARTLQAKSREVVSITDFYANGVSGALVDPTGVIDSTAGIQAAINTGKRIYAPAGRYRLSAYLDFPNGVSELYGDGMDSTIFDVTNITGKCFYTSVALYFRPMWRDFSIIDVNSYGVGTATTTTGIDFSGINYASGGTVFNFAIRNIRIQVGGKCLHVPACFSGEYSNVVCNSEADHAIVANCAQSVVWINCYASKAGPGKAGWRLTGNVTMIGCNGIDDGDWWGVFGQDATASDGFQNDFTIAGGASYPNIQIHGGNMERFKVGGILLHQAASLTVNGQKWDRAGLSTDYDSFLRVRKNTVNNAVISLSIGSLFIGSGAAKGPSGTATGAYIYAETSCSIIDEAGTLAPTIGGGFVSLVYGQGKVPMLARSQVYDVYQNLAMQYPALTARRFSAQTLMYKTTALTPVGTNQAINVTGYTKVTVTPAAAASISTATFTATLGTGSVNDYGRNGDLIIEAGNANLTVVHSASGSNTFRLAGAANIAMATGQILRFCYSSVSSQWIQV